MQLVGIIAEYNPFHNGHLYQINKIKQNYDNVIAIQSGNFSQRGEPTIFDKYTRSKIASNYLDAVFEIPTLYSTSSANIFANASVYYLKNLGCTHISFGIEYSIDEFNDIIKFLLKYDDLYKKELSNFTKKGLSFPNARIEFFKKYNLNHKIISTSNNILAFEYLYCINKNNFPLIPIPIKRTNDFYGNLDTDSNIISATKIREYIKKDIDISNYVPNSYHKNYITIDDFSQIFFNNLLQYKNNNIIPYNSKESTYQRILNNIFDFKNFYSFSDLIKTNDITFSNLFRTFCYIYLNITENYNNFKYYSPNYVRLLQFSNNTTLKYIKNTSNLQIISNIKQLKKLSTFDQTLLNLDINTTSLYNYIFFNKYNILLEPEYKIYPNKKIDI